MLVYSAPPAANLVHCKLGGSGGITQSVSFSGGSKAIPSRNDDYKESGRSSTNVRVENPDDSSQYVEFCRADSVTMTSRNRTPKAPTRTSTYDLSGGMNGGGQKNQTSKFQYQYPEDKACTPRDPPKGGKC